MLLKRKRGAQDDESDALDMTSMIDVVFLLLIFFMCAIQFHVPEGSMQTHLPQTGGSRKAELVSKEFCRVYVFRDATNRVVIVMDDANNAAPSRSDANRNHYEQGRGLPAGPEMTWVQEYLASRQQLSPDLSLVVDFAANVPWKYVNDVIDVSKGLKIEDVAFVQGEIPIE